MLMIKLNSCVLLRYELERMLLMKGEFNEKIV